MSTAPAPVQSVTPEGQQVQQFASKVRAKYPGAYDDLKDADLAKAVVTKHPEYSDMLPHGFAAPETQFEKDRKPTVDASGSLLGRTVRGVGRGLNDAVEGTYQTVMHPLDTASAMATETEQHFKQGMQEPTTIGKMAEFGAAVPGLGPFGKQLGERAAAGDYAGALSEGVTAAAAPEAAREIAPRVAGKVADVTSGARESIGNAVRTPEGNLKPIVKQGARIAAGAAGSVAGTGGTIVGGLAGPEIAEKLLPQTRAGQVARDTAAAIKEGRASKIPTRMPRPEAAKEPLPTIPGATSTADIGNTTTPGSLNAIKSAPSDLTSTGGTPIKFTGPAVAEPKVGKTAKVPQPPEVLRVPEPTSGDPRWVASTPRSKLPGLAMQGKEGAAEQIQNIGKSTIVYEPKGSEFSNVRERSTFGPEGKVAETKAVPPEERIQTPGATKRNAFGEIINDAAPGKSAPTFKTVEQKSPDAPLSEEQIRDARAQIADLRSKARGWAAKQETSRVWTKAHEYMDKEKALLDKADLLEKQIGRGQAVKPALTGATQEELHATYNSAPAEIKEQVDRLAEEYKTLESFEKSRFEHDYGLEDKSGTTKGLPIKEKLARVLTSEQEAPQGREPGDEEEPPF